jgi:hypothetical protein
VADDWRIAKAVTAGHAAAAGAVAGGLFLAPFRPAAALPALAGVAAGAAVLLLPAVGLARREGAGARALGLAAAGAVLGGAPAWAAAWAVAAAGPAGAARAAGGVAALAFLAALAVAARRLPAALVMLAALLVAAIPPVLRFVAIAIDGEAGDSLALISPLEAPAALLGRAAPPARAAPPRADLADPHVESETAGLYRIGLPAPVRMAGRPPLAAPPTALVEVGDEPPFAAAPPPPPSPGAPPVEVHPIFHDRSPSLGPALAAAGGAVDWRAVPAGAPLRLVVDPAFPAGRRGSGLLSLPRLPGSLGGLLAFDAVSFGRSAAPTAVEEDRAAALRALAAFSALAPRPEDPSIDPGRYDVEAPPRLPEATRRTLALIALLGSLAVVVASLLPGRRGAVAGPLAAIAACAAGLALAPPARAVAAERALLYLLPGAPVAAEVRSIEVSAEDAPAAADLALPTAFEDLLPVLFRRPETIPYALVRDPARGPRTAGLTLLAGERRIFDALRPLRLAGPLEVSPRPGGGLRALNRTGRDFSAAIVVGPHDAALLGPLDDGAALDIPREGERVSFAELRESIDRAIPDGPALRRVLSHLFEGRRAPEGGWLVLTGAPAAPALSGLPVETRAAVAVVPLP